MQSLSLNWKTNNLRYLTKEYKVYDSPLLEVISLMEEINFMGSDGSTENYGSGSIWDTGTDNED